tara:strand:- start:3339 stop:3521 length:183 start_codon:yes stop_codon:yes gene_type:complete
VGILGGIEAVLRVVGRDEGEGERVDLGWGREMMRWERVVGGARGVDGDVDGWDLRGVGVD